MVDHEHGQELEDNQRARPRIPVIVRALRAFKRQYHRFASEARKRDIDHKSNERIMARWTRYVGIFTIVLALIAVVSAVISYRALVVIQGQLSEMRSAAEDTRDLIDAAQRTAEAAQDTVNFSKENSQKQLRAYLFVERINVAQDNNNLIILIFVRNSGETPAYKIEFDSNVFYTGINSRLVVIPQNREQSTVSLGRNMVIPTVGQLKITDRVKAIANPETPFIFFGSVKYFDVFDQQHAVKYKFRRTGIVGNTWMMEATLEGNESD